MDDHINTLLALYALGDLTDAEMQQVEQYLATRPEARLRLEELKQLVASDLTSIPPLAASVETRETLFKRVDKDAATRLIARQPPEPTLRDKLRRFWQTPLFTGFGFALAALIAVWGLLLWQQNNLLQTEQAELIRTQQTLEAERLALAARVNTLQTQNETLNGRIQQIQAENDLLQIRLAQADGEQTSLETELALVQADYEALLLAVETAQTELADLRAIEGLLGSPQTHAVTLPGSEDRPDAHGQLIANPDHHLALLVVSALPDLPPEQEYQVLLIYDTGHDTAETFRVDSQGQTVLLIHSSTPFSRYEAVGVSIEPKGGSPQRTGEIVLLGSLVN
jgi:anti-sigma-K factor RskA